MKLRDMSNLQTFTASCVIQVLRTFSADDIGDTALRPGRWCAVGFRYFYRGCQATETRHSQHGHHQLIDLVQLYVQLYTNCATTQAYPVLVVPTLAFISVIVVIQLGKRLSAATVIMTYNDNNRERWKGRVELVVLVLGIGCNLSLLVFRVLLYTSN